MLMVRHFFLALLLAGVMLCQPPDSAMDQKRAALGKTIASEIRRQSTPLDMPEVQEYVGEIGRKLWSSAPELSIEVASFADWREPIPVFNGQTFVPAEGLLSASSEAELAGMLAHSIAHVALGHGAPPLATRNTSAIPIVFWGGWAGSHVEPNTSSPLMPVARLQRQQSDELEADLKAMELLAESGYSLSAYVEYVQRTQGADTANSALPSKELRLDRLKKKASTLTVVNAAVPDGRFEQIQAMVRSLVRDSPAKAKPSLRRKSERLE